MISGVNGFNANVNYDFSSAHGQNLKAREEDIFAKRLHERR